MLSTLVMSVAVVGAVGVGRGAPAFAEGETATAPHWSREADTLVRAARALMNATPPNYAEAIAKLKEADGLPTHSAFEQHLINEMLGFAYLRTNDYADAVKMLESGLNDGQLDEADVPERIRALAQLYYQLKNYDKAIEFGTRTINGGYAGSELNTLVALVGQSYYLKGDWTGTQKFSDELVNGEIKRGETPTKESLWLLYSACVKLHNEECTTHALELLVQYYPKEMLLLEHLDSVRPLKAPSSQ
jgi:tetratricopeptide (TPR) repeat protein